MSSSSDWKESLVKAQANPIEMQSQFETILTSVLDNSERANIIEFLVEKYSVTELREAMRVLYKNEDWARIATENKAFLAKISTKAAVIELFAASTRDYNESEIEKEVNKRKKYLD